MKLAQFIRDEEDAILKAWEEFASSLLPAAKDMNKAALRNHARRMLRTIIQDLQHPQTPEQQQRKSWGLAPDPSHPTAATSHGSVRLFDGFSITEMVSEFRALRASVIKLWSSAHRLEENDIEDLIRFNEAIDQAVAESVFSYSNEKEHQTRLFDTMLTASPDHLYIIDLNGGLVYANKAMADLLGLSSKALVNKNLSDLMLSESGSLQSRIRQVIETKAPVRGEMNINLKGGQHGRYEYFYVPVFDDSGNVEAIAGSGRDITERKQAEEKIWRHANYDALTGLPNRRLFRDRLEHSIKQAERNHRSFALFFIDLDRFKEANDLLGHDAGDKLLKQAAERIQSCVRNTDTVARLGGDEFTVTLLDISGADEVERVARAIIEELAKPFLVQQDLLQISGSIGITLFPLDGVESEQLLRNADQAMYVAKRDGRNRLSFFSEALQQAAWSRLKLTSDLRLALEKRQLVVYYQPIVDLKTGRIVKAEALVRWQHPGRGLLMPSEFIGLAEESGLINEIGDWVFADAVSRIRGWQLLLKQPLEISVNRSPVQFMSAKGLHWGAYLKQLGIGQNSISVEITEGVLLNASAGVTSQLADFQEAGIHVAIDHFGTGYSSMAYIKKFDVDFLKIDQSFVHGMGSDAHTKTIAETIILMAHKLGLKVIAEGVETLEQQRWLASVECDYAQGFLFSEALAPDAFEEQLKIGKVEAIH